MASEGEACCESDPNFAVICAFLEKFGSICGISNVDFLLLQEMLENTHEVSPELIDLHIKLLRKARRSVSNEKWERAIIKLCHTYCSQDAWEIERFGYKKARLSSKIRILKELLEMQFDYNLKFKTEINKMTAQDLRSQPIGKDRTGNAYWIQCDENCHVRIYKEDLDEETWTLVAKDRDGFVSLVSQLSSDDVIEPLLNDDSNSTEVEKPIVDTGQVSDSDSKKEEADSSEMNGINDSSNEAEETLKNDDQAEEEEDEGDEEEEDDEVEEEEEEEVEEEEEHENLNEDELKANTEENKESNKKEENFAVVQKEPEQIEERKDENLPPEEPPTATETNISNEERKEDGTEGALNLSQKKPLLRIKSITELMSQPVTQPPDTSYIRTEPMKMHLYPNPMQHRSLSMKRNVQEEPENLKRPRLNRPTLLGHRKKQYESEEEEYDSESCELGEAIEEPVMYVYGEGNGKDCLTGNENKSDKDDTKSALNDKSEVENSISKGDSSFSVSDKKTQFKLGTIIDVRIDDSTVHRSPAKKSRWDVEPAKEEESVGEKEKVEIDGGVLPNKPMFFFGPGCLQFKPKVNTSVSAISDGNDTSSDVADEKQECNIVTSDIKQLEPTHITSNCATNIPETPASMSEVTEDSKVSLTPKEEIDEGHSKDSSDGKQTKQDISEVSKPTELAEIESQIVTPEETEKDVALPSAEPDVTQSGEIKEDPVIKKTTYECGPSEEKQEGDTVGGSEVSVGNVAESDAANDADDGVTEKGDVQLKNIDEESLQEKDKHNESSDLDAQAENENGDGSSVDKILTLNNIANVDSQLKSSLIQSEIVDGDTSPSKNELDNADPEHVVQSNSIEKTSPEINEVAETDSEDDEIVSTEKEGTKIIVDDDEKVDVVEPTKGQEVRNDTSEQLEVRTLVKEDKEVQNLDSIELNAKEADVNTLDNAVDKLNCANDNSNHNLDCKLLQNDDSESTDNTQLIENESVLDDNKSLNVLALKQDNAVIDMSKNKDCIEANVQSIKKCSIEEASSEVEENNKKEIEKAAQEELVREAEAATLNDTENCAAEQPLENSEKSEPKPLSPKERRITRASLKNKSAVPVDPEKPKIKVKKTETLKEIDEGKKPDENSQNVTPVVTCVSIKNLTACNASPQSVVTIDDDSNSISAIAEKDPLACSDEETTKAPSAPMTLSSFTLDFDGEPVLPVRIPKANRKRGRLSKQEEEEEVAEKRQKLRGKRAADVNLRRSIESQKSTIISSSEEDPSRTIDLTENEPDEQQPEKKSRRRRRKRRGIYYPRKQIPRTSPVPSSDVTSETSRADSVSTPPVVKKAGGPRKRKTMLGLELPAELEFLDEPASGVRQSRRIAQLKIREEAERRKIEEEVNDLKVEEEEKKKKKKNKRKGDQDYKEDLKEEDSTADSDIDDKKKRKRKRSHNFNKLFDGTNPWLHRSDSSSSNEVEEEEEEEEINEFTDIEPKSDHEFSPESDLEDSGEVQPLKRARTAKKESDVDEVDDCACQKCGKKDHPEWILLCDGCDNGWHCSCLRPALLVIPEGDWFCPPCQHVKLVQNLQRRLKEYDKQLSKKTIEDRRKQRLAYVGISLNNVLPAKESDQAKHKVKKKSDSEDGDEDESGSESSESESSSDDDEPIYRLRERRQAHSYRFNDYDELINSAIQDEMEAVKGAGNQGRGKDIATIVNAEKEEEAQKVTTVPTEVEPLPPVVPEQVDIAPAQQEESEEEIRPVKKLVGRKKPRKLNSLDISSGDDHYSDEDFKGTTSTDEEDEEELDDVVTDSSYDSRRGKKNNNQIRRSTRARIARYDREFINDDSDEDEAPRRKKTRSIWDESESEESDQSWGSRRRKRRTGGSRNRKSSNSKRKTTKKKKKKDDSDSDAFKKRKPKIKYGRINSDNEDLGIRTRGKKINYLDVLGSDSDDDVPKKVASKVEESEEEYVVNEEEVLEQEREEEENEKESSDDEDSEEDENDKLAKHIKSKKKKQAKLESVIDKLHMNPVVQLEKAELADIRVPPPDVARDNIDGRQKVLNPIEEINRNIEEMSEKDMEKMMEEESYANSQLALVALQIEKEKRRKEQEAKNLEMLMQQNQKGAKKRGRKDQPDIPVDMMMNDYANNAELSEPPGVSLPIFGDLPPLPDTLEEAPKKRKGRGKGKKTLAAEAAKKAAESHPPVALAPSSSPIALSPMHNAKLSVAAPPQPFSQSQPAPSVITRMLQSQPYPVSTSGGYYASEPQHADIIQAGAGQYMPGTNSRIPAPNSYRAPPQGPLNMSTFQPRHPPVQQPLQMRGNPSLHLLQQQSPQQHDRNSPALIPPPSDSPLGGKPESAAPPSYGGRPTGLARYPTGGNGGGPMLAAPPPRHVQLMQGHVATPPQRPNSMSPYPPPGVPASYYAPYGPPPPLVGSADDAPPAAYQTPPYAAPADQYSTDGPGIAVSESGDSKGFDEESGGEFGGLVSYFSSQREDDLDA